MDKLIERAEGVFRTNFPPTTWFERAIFFSWYCRIRDCAFCYMSAAKHTPKARRTHGSILAELIISKALGWRIGFVSGGVGAFEDGQFHSLLEKMYLVAGEKLWLNVGALGLSQIKQFLPFVKGLVASVETINPEIHSRVCPSKPLEPYERMLINAVNLKVSTAITLIVGLGETPKDYPRLKRFLKRYRISKIHFYCFNPQSNTPLEDLPSPSPEQQAWWIAKTRIDFPKMDIQAGIWLDKAERVGLLLRAGANSISKFPALRNFGCEAARMVEEEAARVGREFQGTLTKVPLLNPNMMLCSVPRKLHSEIMPHLNSYLLSLQKKYHLNSSKNNKIY